MVVRGSAVVVVCVGGWRVVVVVGGRCVVVVGGRRVVVGSLFSLRQQKSYEPQKLLRGHAWPERPQKMREPSARCAGASVPQAVFGDTVEYLLEQDGEGERDRERERETVRESVCVSPRACE